MTFRQRKGMVELYIGLDTDGYLTEFVALIMGKKHEIKTFLGASRNAVMTQLWIALIVYLMLSYLKFKAQIDHFIHRILRLLQLNLFERRNFIELFKP